MGQVGSAPLEIISSRQMALSSDDLEEHLYTGFYYLSVFNIGINGVFGVRAKQF